MLRRLLLFLFVLGLSFSGFAQTFTVEAEQSLDASKDSLIISIYVSSDVPGQDLGTSNFVFRADTSAIDLTSGRIDPAGSPYNDVPAVYDPMAYGYLPGNGHFQLDVRQVFPLAANGAPVPVAPVRQLVGNLIFSINPAGKCLIDSLRWSTVPSGTIRNWSGVVATNKVAPAEFLLRDSIGATVSITAATDTICEGSDNDIAFLIDGENPLDVYFSNGTDNFSILGAGNLDPALPYSPTITGEAIYVIDSIIDRNGCVETAAANFTSDTAFIDQNVTPAAAGNDTTVCSQPKTVQLNANNPAIGNGIWSQVGGPGTINFGDPTVFNTNADADQGGVYTLEWKIESPLAGAVGACPADSDEVVIEYLRRPEPANAGADSFYCVTGGFPFSVNLFANEIDTGIGTWTLISGQGGTPVIASPNDSASSFTVGGAAPELLDGPYTLRWRTSNGPLCPADSDDVIITIDVDPATPVISTADFSQCEETANISANVIPNPATGQWLASDPGVSFGSIISNNTTVTLPSLPVDSTYFIIWESFSAFAVCDAKRDTLLAERFATPDAAEVINGSTTPACGGTVNYTISNANPGSTYTWILPGGFTLSAINSPDSTDVDITLADPSFAGDIIIIENITATGCSGGVDTLAVVPTGCTFQASFSVFPNDTVCIGQVVTLNSNTAGHIPGSTEYSWDSTETGPFTNISPLTVDDDTISLTFNDDGTYQVRMTASEPTLPPNPLVDDTIINIVVLSAANGTLVLNSPNTICEGDTVEFQVNITGGAPPYTVELDTGGLPIQISPYNPGDPIRIIPTSNSTTYTLLPVLDGFGCAGGLAAGSFAITRNPAPRLSIVGANPGTICDGDSTQIRFSATGALPFNNVWVSSVAGTENITITTDPQDVFFTPPTAGLFNYSIDSVEDNNGCFSKINSPITSPNLSGNALVTVNDGIDSASFGTSQAICFGESTFLTAEVFGGDAGSGPNYTYWFTGRSDAVQPSPYTFPDGPPTSQQYILDSVEDAYGCVVYVEDTVDLTVNPLPAATFARVDSDPVCLNDSAEFTITFGAGVGLKTVYFNVDGTPDSLTILNDTTIFFQQTAVGAASYELDSLRDANGCSAPGTDGPFTVNTVDAPTATVFSGGDDICAGESDSLVVVITGGTAPYDVFVDAFGATPFTALNATDSFEVSPLISTIYTLDSVVDVSGCSVEPVGQTTTTIVNPLPTAVISGDATICEGNPTNLTFNFTPVGNTFTVTYTTGDFDSTISGLSDGDFVTISPEDDSTYTLVSVTDEVTGCVALPAGLTGSATITVNPNTSPSVSVVQTPANPVCAGDPITFTVIATDTSALPSWQWYQNDAALLGQNSNTLNVPSLADGTEIKVELDVSAAGCATPFEVFDSVIVDVQPSVAPSITLSQSPSNPVCPDDTLLFEATIVGGGASPSLAWTLDGAPLLPNDELTKTLISGYIDGSEVEVTLTSSLSCATPASSSATAIINVDGSVTPFVNIIQVPSNPVCAADSVIFIADNTGAGANPAFSWFVNGIAQAVNNDTFTYFPRNDLDSISVLMTSSSSCAAPGSASDGHLLNIETNITPLISVSQTPNGPVCPTEDVVFDATISGGGNNPLVQWYVDGVLQASSEDFTFFNVPVGGPYTVEAILTSNASCASITTDTFTTSVNVQSPVDPTVSIVQNPANPVCDGDPVNFSVSATGQGSNPGFQWFYEGALVSTASTYNAPSVADEDEVIVIMTSSNPPACTSDPVTSDTIEIQTETSIPLAGNIVSDPVGVQYCPGQTVTFSFQGTGQGSNPTYTWTRSGLPGIQSTDSTWTYTLPTTSPAFYAVAVNVTSSNSCAVPASQPFTVPVIVNPGALPDVEIVQTPGNPVCPGENINFTVNTQNEGTNPSYEWFVNGVSQTTNPNGVFSGVLADGDEVVVELTTTACSGTASVSDTVIIQHDNPIIPQIEIDVTPDSTLCLNEFVTFTANATGQGPNPSYTWLVNGTPVSNGTFYTTSFGTPGVRNVQLILNRNQACGGPTLDTASMTVTVVPTGSPVVSIVRTPGGPICNGDPVTFEASGTFIGLSPTFEWRKNGIIFNYGQVVSTTINNGDDIRVDVSYTNPCSGASSTFAELNNIATSPPGTPSVAIIQDPENPICPNELIQFTTIDTLEGNSPSYRWFKNGILEVADPTYTYFATTADDTIIVEMTSSSSCATPSTVRDTVITKFIQTELDTAIGDTTTFCFGDSVTLILEDTANVTIEWFSLNSSGADVSLGTNFNVTLFDTDSVYGVISNGRCTENTDTVLISVFRPYSGTITNSNPGALCFGENTTLSVQDSAGFTFQWLYGFDSIPGATNDSISVDYTGSFNVIVQNNVCIDTVGSVNVQVTPPIDSTLSILIGDSTFCEDDSVLIAVPSVRGNALGGRLGSSYVQTSFPGILGNNSRTLEAWIQTDTSGGIMGYGNDATGQGFVVRINNAAETPGPGVDGALKVAVRDGFVTGTTVISDNNPHHIAVVFEGDSLNDVLLYVDGQLEVISDIQNQVVNTQANINLRIGTTNVGFMPAVRFGGRIDEVRVWDFALDSASINNNRNVPLIGTEPGLAGLWNFEDTTGGTAKDIVAGNDGTLEFGARFIPEGGFYVPVTPVTYEWIDAGTGTPFSGPGADFFYWVTASGEYYVIVENNGCTQISDTLNIREIILDPVITNSSPVNLCFGESVTLSSTNTSAQLDSIEWLFAGNGIIVNNDSSFTATGSGGYSVVYYDAGCSDTSNTVIVNVAAEIDTTMTIDGDTALCDGDTTFLSVPLYGGNNLRQDAKTSVIRDIGNTTDFAFIHEEGRFTLQYWQKLDNPNQNPKIHAALGNAFDGSDPGFFAGYQRGNVGGINLNGQFKLHLDGGGAPWVFHTTGTPQITDTNWHHITIVVDSNEARFYMDNVLLPSTIALGSPVYSPATPATNLLTIGDANSFPGAFDLTNRGGVDEVRIWNLPLDSASIANNWNRPLNGNEPGLVALFDLDEDTSATTGDFVNDLTANAFTGTLNGTARISNQPNSMPADSLVYQWNEVSTGPIAGADSNVLAVDTTGSYFVVISTANGLCVDTSRTVDIVRYSLEPQIAVTSVNDTVCFGDSVELTAINAFGTPYDSVGWYLGSQLVSTNIIYNANVSGQYSMVMYSNVCSDTSDLQAATILNEIDTSLFVYGDTVLCEGDSVTLAAPLYGSASLSLPTGSDKVVGVGSVGDYDFVHQTGNFTMEFWARFDDPARVHSILGNIATNGTTPGFNLNMFLNTGTGFGRLRLRISNGSSTTVFQSVDVLNAGNFDDWNHFAVSMNDSEVTFYFNGNEISSVNNTFTTAPAPSTNALELAGLNSSMIGNLDELRIWNFEIDSATIAHNYNRPLNGDPSLVRIYNFDTDSTLGDTDIVFDNSGLQSGTLSGAGIATVFDNPFQPSAELTYQWYKDATAITGATQNFITIADSGEYYVEIDNSFGCGPEQSRTIEIQQNLISDTLFASPTEFCFGTDSARIWVDLNLYDSVQIYDLAFNQLASLTSPLDTFYVTQTETVYGLIFNTIDDRICTKFTDTVIITAFENPDLTFANDTLIICFDSLSVLYDLALGDTIIEGAGPVTNFAWSPDYNLADSSDLNTIYTASPDTVITFSLTVTDANGCFDTDSITAETNPRIDVALQVDTLICFGESLDLGAGNTITGGKAPASFDYLWDNDTLFQNIADTSNLNPLITGDSAGIYSYILLVTDQQTGCIGLDTLIVEVNDSIDFSALNLIDTICFNTDTITIGGAPTAQGGSGTIVEWAWTPATNLNDSALANPDFINPGVAGTYVYTVTATDDEQCARTSNNVTVEVAPEIIVDAGLDTVACFGDTSIVIGGAPTATGGFGTFSYEWTVVGGVPAASTILDDITSPNPTIIYTSALPASLQFVVTVGDSSSTLLDRVICDNSDTVTVIFNPEIVVNGGITNAVCFADTTQLGGQATGGSSNTFNYIWTGNINTTILSPNDSASLIVGTIGDGTDTLILTAVDAVYPQCINSDTILFNVNDTVDVNAGADTILCFQQAVELGGLIPNTSDTTASGGSGTGFNYLWTGVGGTSTFFLSGTSIKNPIFNQASSLDTFYSYQVEVTDLSPLACNAFDTINITVNERIIPDPNVSDSLCFGDSLTLGGSPAATGGFGGFTYLWSSQLGNSIINPTDENPVLVSTAHGIDSIKLLVTDARSCQDSASITVEVDSLPSISFLPSGGFYICRGEDTTIIASATSGNQLPNNNALTYDWNNGVLNNSIINVQPNVDTTYEVTVTNQTNGCSNSDTINIEVKPLPFNEIREGSTILGDTLRTCSTPNLLPLQIINDSSITATSFWTLLDPPGPTTIPMTSTSVINILKNQLNVNGNTIQNITTDIFGCVNVDSVYITTNNLPNATFNVSDSVLCFGDSITLEVNGVPLIPTPSFSFVRNLPTAGSITSNPFDSVASFVIGENFPPVTNWTTTDTFEYEVLINTGCLVSLVRDVIVHPNPVLELLSPDTLCFGDDTLLTLINLNPGPQAPLDSFAWNITGIDTSQILLTSFSDTIISVTVADTNGCISSVSDTIYSKALPDISLNNPGPITFCDGDTANIFVPDNPNYTYEWRDSPNSAVIGTNSLYVANDSGLFYVTVTTDGLACVDSSSKVDVTAFQLPVPALDTIGDSTRFCFGDTKGLTELSAFPGYDWNEITLGSLGNTTNTLIISDSGQYFVVVTDANGCIDTSAVIEFFEIPLSVDSVTGPDTVCANAQEVYNATAPGIWRLAASRGSIVGANLSGGFFVTPNPVNQITVNWLGANNAQIFYTPDVECAVQDTFDVTIIANPVAAISGPTSGCFGDILEITATNLGDSYQWNISSTFGTLTGTTNDTVSLDLNQPVVSINGFDTASIQLIQTAGSGCSDTARFLITKYEFASAEWRPATIDTAVCVNERDTFSIQNAVAGATYNFTVVGGIQNNIANGIVEVTWNTAGTGSIRCIASNGDCADTVFQEFNIQITPFNTLTSSVDGVPQAANPDRLCLTIDSITYRINAGQVAPTDVLAWSVIGDASPTPSSVSDSTLFSLNLDTVGQYILEFTQTSSNGCVLTFQETVIIDGEPTLDTILGPRVVCENTTFNYTFVGTYDPDSIVFTPSSGDITLNGPLVNQVQSISWGAPDPNKFVAIEFSRGDCRAFDTLFAQVDAIPNAFVSPIIPLPGDTTFCQNKTTRFFANPIDSTYSYQWYLNGNPLQNGDTSVIIVTESGNYSFAVETLALGCRDSSDVGVVANVLGIPDAEITGDTLLCSGDSVELSVVNTADSYQWYYDTLNPSLISTNVTSITALVPGQYFVVLQNAGNGCTDTSDAFIIRPLADAVSLFQFDSINSFCNNDTIALNGNNFGELLEFEWTTNGQGQIADPFTDTTVYIPSDLDSGLIFFEFSVSNICIESISSDTALLRPSPNAEYTPSVLVAELNETVVFTPNTLNATLYEWVFQPGATGTGQTGLHTYTQAGDYLSFLIATNEFNCSDSFAVPIHVTRNQLIYVPNVFSPNATDPDNRVMRIYGTNIAAPNFEIVIYNRWGTKVFESTDLTEMKTNGWDGKLRNGAELPNGVYTYYIKGKFFNDEDFQQVGTVSLIK